MYLPTLLEQKKWNAKKRNLRVGDVILIADENYPRGAWPLVRVVKVVIGSDGLARSATVRTTSTVPTRSRRKRKEETSVSTVILTRTIVKLSVYTEENSETIVAILKNRGRLYKTLNHSFNHCFVVK